MLLKAFLLFKTTYLKSKEKAEKKEQMLRCKDLGARAHRRSYSESIVAIWILALFQKTKIFFLE